MNLVLGDSAKMEVENLAYSDLYKQVEKLNKTLNEKTYEWEVLSEQKEDLE